MEKEEKDMWKDIADLERHMKRKIQVPTRAVFHSGEIAKDLMKCYEAKYSKNEGLFAEELKEAFKKKYGYWKYY